MSIKLQKILKNENDNIKTYVIVDGAKCTDLWLELDTMSFQQGILFEDEELQNALSTVAPYLIQLTFDKKRNEDLKKILSFYEEDASLFFSSKNSFEDVLKKVRELFIVKSKEEKTGYLRFYSPKIFTEILKDKNVKNIEKLFFNIESFYCEDEYEKNTLCKYTYVGKQIIKEELEV